MRTLDELAREAAETPRLVQLSVRLREDMHTRLSAAAAAAGCSMSALIGALLDEAVRMRDADASSEARASLVQGAP